MKVSENIAATPSESSDWPSPARPVAPWWHAALLVIIILGVSILSAFQSKAAGFGSGHIRRYIITIAWEWLLALLAWWGLRMRRTPLRAILGLRRRGLQEWARDFGAALIFWILAVVVLAGIAGLLRLAHFTHAQKAVLAIAPQTIVQVLVWIALCCTAGFVEEFVFRGYFLQQFASIRGGVWIGIIVSSLLFGAAHGYEGLGAMVAITAYGIMFCLLAIYRGSLRTGMIAHAWHDAIAGIALAIASRGIGISSHTWHHSIVGILIAIGTRSHLL